MLNPIQPSTYREVNVIKLTGRQRQYLQQMVRLQAVNSDEPVHYSTLAEKLGISTISAYNMLRVLEQKGCVRSSYELSGLGVGRSSVLFDVTAAGREIAAD